uniref:Uncharacterized protein n=1 Tax=Sphaerodactylus townsendi TaxID=933632 RepID=A0ACB8F4E0_9SAUR
MAKAVKGRKNSIPDMLDKAENDSKMDQLMEMMIETRNESVQRFNKLEDKLCNLGKTFEKIEKDLDEVKGKLSKLKPLENRIQKTEEILKKQEETNEKVERKLSSYEGEIERLTKQNVLLELRQKERILRFRGVPPKDRSELNKTMINNLAKYLDIDEEKKMTIDMKEIIILKEIPKWILNRRKEYSPIVNFLRRENISFKWEELEGIQFTYSDKFYRLSSVTQIKETLEKIKLTLKSGNK